jgi:hypothetical protein
MPVQILDPREGGDPRKDLHEELIIKLDFGKWILDVDRMSMETSLETLFRLWLDRLLKSGDNLAISTLGKDDFADFQAARQHILERIPDYYLSSVSTSEISRLRIVLAFILLDILPGSEKKRVVPAMIFAFFTGVASTFGVLSADYIWNHPEQIKQVATTAVVHTEKTAEAFVNHLNAIKNNPNTVELTTEARSELLNVYSRLAMLPNGELTVIASSGNKEKNVFKVTSDEARKKLPDLAKGAIDRDRKS